MLHQQQPIGVPSTTTHNHTNHYAAFVNIKANGNTNGSACCRTTIMIFPVLIQTRPKRDLPLAFSFSFYSVCSFVAASVACADVEAAAVDKGAVSATFWPPFVCGSSVAIGMGRAWTLAATERVVWATTLQCCRNQRGDVFQENMHTNIMESNGSESK